MSAYLDDVDFPPHVAGRCDACGCPLVDGHCECWDDDPEARTWPTRDDAARRAPVTVVRLGHPVTTGRLLAVGCANSGRRKVGPGKAKVQLASGAVITVPAEAVIVGGAQ